MLDQQRPGLLLAELLLQQGQPLAHRRGRLAAIAVALVAAAPAHQQVVPRREQAFEQHIAVLVAGVGIAQEPLLLHQVETGPFPLAGKAAAIEAHQHDHPVGDGPHRLQGTDRERAAAVAKAAAVGIEALGQDFGQHGRPKAQGAAGRQLLPVGDGAAQQLQLPGPLAPVAKPAGQERFQHRRPVGRSAGDGQPLEAVAQPVQ